MKSFRILRGGENTYEGLNKTIISTLTGIPKEILERPVLISKVAKNAMQDGKQNCQSWKIAFQGGEADHWANPLMGWASSRDPVNILNLEFDTLDAAKSFCTTRSLTYEVLPDNQGIDKRCFRPKSYSDNFSHKFAKKDPSDIY